MRENSLESSFPHVSNRNVFSAILDTFQPPARAARENSVVRSLESVPAKRQEQMFISSVTSLVSHEAGHVLNALALPLWSSPPKQTHWVIPIPKDYPLSAPALRPTFDQRVAPPTPPPRPAVMVGGPGERMAPDHRKWLALSFIGTAVTLGVELANFHVHPTIFGSDVQADDASIQDEFVSDFRVAPEAAVDRLVEKMQRAPGGSLVAAKIMLPYLVQASYGQQNLFLDALLRTSTPADVLGAALILSEGAHNDAILEAAAGVLENFGSSSWPALANFAASRDHRCRHFVRAVGVVPVDNSRAKIATLVVLAQNPDLETRWLAAQVAEEVSTEAAKTVWKVLCADRDEQLKMTAESQASL